MGGKNVALHCAVSQNQRRNEMHMDKVKIVTITMLLALLLIGTIEATKVAEANENKSDASQAVDLQLNLSQSVHIDGQDMSEIMNNAVRNFREKNGYNISFTVVCELKLNECQYGKAVEQQIVKGTDGVRRIKGTTGINGIVPYSDGWHEWVSSADSSGTSPVGEAWNVPTAPPAGGAGQVLFFFNGKDDNRDGGQYLDPLLQPVLEWNNGGSNRWQIRSWWIFDDNSGLINSSLLDVDVGDTIFGEVHLDAWNHWVVLTWDEQKGIGTGIGTTETNFLYRKIEVLETYYVTSCNQLSGSATFYPQAYNDLPLLPVLNWNVGYWEPFCNMQVSVSYYNGKDYVTFDSQ